MKDKTISLLFSGDFAPLLKPEDISGDHFRSLHVMLNDSDLHITNLECPLTLSDESIEKSGPAIKAHPDNIELLKQAKVDIACMANNHIFDYNEKGITDTLRACKSNGIDSLGLVFRSDGQKHWLIKEIKDKRVGFLNYCEHEFSVRDPDLLGACGYHPIDAFYDIQNLKPQVDFLIVIYHGGNEYYPLPNPDLKKIFHYLADLGADAVVGHHTHVFSGYEIYKGKPLVYSLGNFFFPYEDEPDEWHAGIMLQLDLCKKLEFKIIPITQCKNNLKVVFPEKERNDTILSEIENLSEIIINDSNIIRNWNEYVKKRGVSLTKLFLCSTRIERFFFRIKWINQKSKYVKRAMVLNNVMRCQSLNSVAKASLKSDFKL
jgi:Bacterial capsule synthesis protein PGA_cap